MRGSEAGGRRDLLPDHAKMIGERAEGDEPRRVADDGQKRTHITADSIPNLAPKVKGCRQKAAKRAKMSAGNVGKKEVLRPKRSNYL